MSEVPAEIMSPTYIDWQDLDHSGPVKFRSSVYADLIAHIPPDQRSKSATKLALDLFLVMLKSCGFRTTLIYRLSHQFRYRYGLLGRIGGYVLFWWNRHWYGCDMSPACRLHGGVILPHPRGIVIGADVIIGPRAWIFQNVTIGGAPGKEGMPKIGADARIYTGAVIAGPLTIGDNVMIAANAVVSQNIPSKTVVRLPNVILSPLPEQFRVTSESDLNAEEM